MTVCRVAAIGREIARLDAESERLEEELLKPSNLRTFRLEAREEELLDRLDHLRAEATLTESESLPGALVQIMVVCSCFHELLDTVGGNVDGYQVRALRRSIFRALYSAAGAIAAHGGGNPEDLGATRFMAPSWNPFQLVDAASDQG